MWSLSPDSQAPPCTHTIVGPDVPAGGWPVHVEQRVAVAGAVGHVAHARHAVGHVAGGDERPAHAVAVEASAVEQGGGPRARPQQHGEERRDSKCGRPESLHVVIVAPVRPMWVKLVDVTDEATQHPIHRAARKIVHERQIDEFLYGALVSGSILAVSSAHAEDSGLGPARDGPGEHHLLARARLRRRHRRSVPRPRALDRPAARARPAQQHRRAPRQPARRWSSSRPAGCSGWTWRRGVGGAVVHGRHARRGAGFAAAYRAGARRWPLVGETGDRASRSGWS